MTIGMFGVSSTSAAVFTTNVPGSGEKLGHITLEPVIILEVWENPAKADPDPEDEGRFCDMFRVLTSLGLGWMNDEEVRLAGETREEKG